MAEAMYDVINYKYLHIYRKSIISTMFYDNMKHGSFGKQNTFEFSEKMVNKSSHYSQSITNLWKKYGLSTMHHFQHNTLFLHFLP